MTKQKCIAIGGINTECSTYSPLIQIKSDFEKIQGPQLADMVGFPFTNMKLK